MQAVEIKTYETQVDITHEAFANIPKNLIPTSKDVTISFKLIGANSAIANAIRICTLEEIPWKSLHVEIKDINTTEKDIIINEFQDRIGLIKLDQDTHDDAKFSLHAANALGNLENLVVYSGDINRAGGSTKASSDLPFDKKFRLAILNPGKVLQVSNISVVTGYGYEHGKFTTCSFKYDVLDYMDVYYLSDKEQIISHMTAVADIARELGGAKAKGDIRGKKVIVIPNPDIIKACSERIKEKVKGYDFVIESEKVKPTPSSVANPKDFSLSFTFFCKVDPKEVIVRSLQTLKDRLSTLKSHIDSYPEEKDTLGLVEITVSRPSGKSIEIAEVLIRNEDDVIGNLVVKNIMLLDPKTAMANYMKIHPSNRSVMVKVMHPQSLKIISDAVKKAHDDFDTLQKQFTK
jgi:DNA-directed RNA polymerase subunit L